MRMEIHLKLHQMSLTQPHSQLPNLKSVGMLMLVRVAVPPVQIVTPCIHAHMAAADPVRVDHRHALEHEVIPQFLCVLVVGF